MRRTAVAAVLAAMVALFPACGGDDADGGGSADDQDPAVLEGASWVLTQYVNAEGDTEIVSGINAEFDGSNMSGFTECNSYEASYEASGNEISIGDISATERECPGPDGTIEARYLELLGTVATFEVSGRSMSMSDTDGTAVLQFMKG